MIRKFNIKDHWPLLTVNYSCSELHHITLHCEITYSDVQVGGHHFAGLAHLVLIGSVASVHCRQKESTHR